jgi:hypothetical protein
MPSFPLPITLSLHYFSPPPLIGDATHYGYAVAISPPLMRFALSFAIRIIRHHIFADTLIVIDDARLRRRR